MADLIKRSYILKIIEMWMKVPSYSESERNIMRAIDYEVRTAPSAEPKEPKTGRWTIETIGEIPRYRDSSIYEPIYKCSCCGRTTESYVRFEEPIMPEDADFPKYCPNCGASMEVTE